MVHVRTLDCVLQAADNFSKVFRIHTFFFMTASFSRPYAGSTLPTSSLRYAWQSTIGYLPDRGRLRHGPHRPGLRVRVWIAPQRLLLCDTTNLHHRRRG